MPKITLWDAADNAPADPAGLSRFRGREAQVVLLLGFGPASYIDRTITQPIDAGNPTEADLMAQAVCDLFNDTGSV